MVYVLCIGAYMGHFTIIDLLNCCEYHKVWPVVTDVS